MSLRDLVQQWADVEPERCKAGGGYLTDRWMAIQLDGRMRSWIDGWSGGQKTVNEAVLLAAVIEAIEARGGGVRLELITDDDDDQEHWAIVHVRRPTFGRAEVRGASNAEAALAAYLKAVQHHQAGE